MALLLTAHTVLAQPSDTSSDPTVKEMSTVIVTGTRKTDMTVTDSPAPIQLVSAENLKTTNAPDLQNAIAMVVPSYNSNQVGNDMASQTLTASLRFLSANHTLVLVNGKRIHITANVNTSNGDDAADLSFIPQEAIDHVEVLTDGAAALYGSDAIAGVVNIILKKNHSGGEVSVGYSKYGDGGGKDPKAGANIAFGDEKNFFSLSAESENRQSIYRFGPQALGNCLQNLADCQKVAAAYDDDSYAGWAALDPLMQNARLNPKFPYLNNWLNPPAVHRETLYFNAGAQLTDDISFYAFGGFGKKRAQSEENYRAPDQLPGYTDPVTGNTSYMYLLGFNPSEASREKDFQLTAGLNGNIAGWAWDLSSGLGKNRMNVYTLNSENQSLYSELGYSPANFYDGAFKAGQWTTNFNLTRDFQVGLSAPLTLNAGLEYRKDSYGIAPGDPASYYKVGASSFPGYGPGVAGSYNRNAKSVFADAVFYPVEHWLVDIAARYENYSDFGSKVIGKLTTRFDFSEAFAIRGTASTGFRAPNLGEEYYTQVAVGPSSANPILQPNNPAVGALLGSSGLKPETSTNYSLGFVFRPLENLNSTLDFYRITIANRVVPLNLCYTSGSTACVPTTGVATDSYNVALGNALVSSGYLGAIDPNVSGGSLDPTARENISVSVFYNAIKTRTQGLDWVTNYHSDFDWASIDWLLAINYNKMTVLSAAQAPVSLGGGSVLSQVDIVNLEKNNPKYRINFGPTFNVGKFSFTVSEQVYGPQYQWAAANTNNDGFGIAYPASVLSQLTTATFDGGTYFKERIAVMALTNLSVTFKPSDMWSLTAGGNNIFNKYPSGWPKAAYQFEVQNYENQWGMLGPYQTSSPVGLFGAYWFANATFKF
ncbi:MAG: TonB-dependent receptor [Rudaea sp.]|uniref:TonB-dependent receptor plug domain-containing protein n=1 Tax=Rudaea sp. TaxID=2136325 RepID=UPI0039E28F92